MNKWTRIIFVSTIISRQQIKHHTTHSLHRHFPSRKASLVGYSTVSCRWYPTMSCEGDVQKSPAASVAGSSAKPAGDSGEPADHGVITVTIGATVPTGFERMAADEVKERIGMDATISKDRGRIYFKITTDKLFQVHHLKSVDNLFVVVEEYDNYHFKGTKEEALADLQELASKLPWTNALEVWRLNNSLKKKRGWRRKPGGNGNKRKLRGQGKKDVMEVDVDVVTSDAEKMQLECPASAEEGQGKRPEVKNLPTGELEKDRVKPEAENGTLGEQGEEGAEPEGEVEPKVLKFRVTCSRAGDKHSFSSNEAARDFGGAVQDFFQWKADMTKFDVEVLLNIHKVEVVIGIALTEESLHRRNITHFGPTTLRSTLCYGMLRMSDPQASDVILDPMCGTGAIPLEGAIEWQQSYFLAGDNNDMAVSRTLNNISHIHKKRRDKGSDSPGLPIDTVQWDLCHLPLRTSSVDIIITDMPFGKRMGSRKKNWDLYPSCLREMARVSRPHSGKAVLLTQDKKCFALAIARMGGLWRKMHTVWVNVGGLHAGVYVLKRTGAMFGQTPEDIRSPVAAEGGPIPEEVRSTTTAEGEKAGGNDDK